MKKSKQLEKEKKRYRISINGAVQGVGFRPFIYRLAQRMNLLGWVSNNPQGVIIEVEEEKEKVYQFISRIYEEKPPSATIENLQVEILDFFGYQNFEIRESQFGLEKKALILPDIATCPDCLEELFNPKNRRYLYPFINCTQCGPRFTIIKDIPYDRPNTTMNVFRMCERCEKEYNSPENRRFHAQPNACWECGPAVRLQTSDDRCQKVADGKEAIEKCAELLRQGYIVGIKSLGGYQIACDATNEELVKKLRERKKRIAKPFALMAKDLKMIERYCEVNEREKQILSSFRAPIVLLKKKKDIDIAKSVALNNNYLGFMFAYTPLHHLLFKYIDRPLVMTSGNITDEPIYYRDEEAFEKLKNICDYFLTHNREIHIRCDDSVTRIFLSLDGKFNKEYVIRRARGYAPVPITLDYNFKKPILAVGPYLKNTFALAKDNHVFISHHIGDLDNLASTLAFEEGIKHFGNIFQIEPEVIAHDVHPEYYSTKYAKGYGGDVKLISVQHHHAHIVSCMIENNIKEHVLGVAFDGTGYGLDDTIWGGEILISNLKEFKRVAHLEYLPQPGAKSAIKNPWQMAISWLYYSLGDEIFNLNIDFIKRIGEDRIKQIIEIIKNKINSPLTSSMGRLFASISSLLGICDKATYEGEAEMKLEQIQDLGCKEFYDFEIDKEKDIFIIIASSVIRQIISDIEKGISKDRISAKFHNGLVEITYKLIQRLKKKYKINKICLSGGVFQNMVLLSKLYQRLSSKNFKVFIQGKVPANDGGISLGQAVIANELI
jgi:hydrogenase maturation protein HypF